MFRSTRPRFFVALFLLIVVAALPPFSGAQQQPPRPISRLGQIGGYSGAVAVRGDRAYLGIGPRVYVLDISDRTKPRFVTRTEDTNNQINDITLDGPFAYVSAGSKGLMIYDISNQDRLRLVSVFDTPGDAGEAFVSNGLAYIADRSGGLRIVDVSQPERPLELNAITFRDFVWGVTVDNNRVYVANGSSGLKVFDATDRISLTEIGYGDVGDSFDVVVTGTYAYVADHYGLRTFDISDLSDISETDIFYTDGLTESVDISNGYVFVTDASTTGLHVFALNDPAHPELTKTVTTKSGSIQVMVVDSYAYLAQLDLGLAVFDVSNPQEPREIGSYTDVGAISGYFLGTEAVVVSSGFAYTITNAQRLSIIDVRQPESPREASAFNYECCIVQHLLSDHYMYVFLQDSLSIIDIADPAQPREVKRTAFGTTSLVAIQGNSLYAVINNDELRIYDITDRTNPRETGSVSLNNRQASHLLVSGQYVYLFASFGLYNINISDSTTPKIEGYLRVTDIISDVAMEGSAIYAATQEGFVIFDVENPKNMTRSTAYEFELDPGYSFYARGIAIQDDTVYLVNDTGLYQFDMTDRTIPVLTHRRLNTPFADVAVDGSTIYTTSRSRGLETLMVLDGLRIYLPSISH